MNEIYQERYDNLRIDELKYKYERYINEEILNFIKKNANDRECFLSYDLICRYTKNPTKEIFLEIYFTISCAITRFDFLKDIDNKEINIDFLKAIDYNLLVPTIYDFLQIYFEIYETGPNQKIDCYKIAYKALLIPELLGEYFSKIAEACFYLIKDFEYFYKDTPKIAKTISKFLDFKVREISEYIFLVNEKKYEIINEENDNYDNYILGNKIAEGSYGDIFEAKNRDKNIIIKKSKRNIGYTDIREISILKKVNHPNIVKLFTVKIIDRKVILILEKLDIDLLRYFNLEKDWMSTKYIFKGICNGLYYLHTNGIIHRDLTPANILINENRREVKITDFGSSRPDIFGGFWTGGMTTYCFSSLEMLEDEKYSMETDIWSLGMILIFMNYFDLELFRERDKNIIMSTIKKFLSLSFKRLNLDANDLVQKIFTTKDERINICEIMKHPYLK